MLLIKPSYFQEEMKIYERKLQWYMTPLRTLLSYSFLRNKLKVERQAEIPDWNQLRPGPLTRRILDTPSKQRQSRSLVCNSILEMRTRLNTLTSLSPPWHTGCTLMKSDVFSSPPPFLAEL
ncbi:hypothetical protein ACFXTO_006483 [Malus domestica]